MAKDFNQKRLLGEAGEHLVLSRLLSRGLPAAQRPRAWAGDDVILESGLNVSVKTTSSKKRSWMAKEGKANPKRYWALVHLHDVAEPVVYVVPDAVIQLALSSSLAAYVRNKPKFKGAEIRKLEDPWGKDNEPEELPSGWLEPYRENWDQLT